MDTIPITVVIPTYNRIKELLVAIEKIQQCDPQPQEIIVHIDFGDQTTEHALKLVQEKYKHIRVIQSDRRVGPGGGRNKAVQDSNGEYVVFLDSDDLWFHWTLSTYKLVIEKTNSLFIAGNINSFWQNSDLKPVFKEELDYKMYANYILSAEDSVWVQTGSAVIERQALALIQSGCFSEKRINGEDSDLWLKSGTLAPFIFLKSPFLSAYRRHDVSKISDNQKSYLGAIHVINQETNHFHLGDFASKRQRLDIITKHTRPISLVSLKEGYFKKAWQVYQYSFLWNLLIGRVKYLIAFWIFSVKKIIESKWSF